MWSFVGGKPLVNRWKDKTQIPASTSESDMMSKAMKKAGFTFVGTTICYAHMQVAGMVNDLLVTCFRYRELLKARSFTSCRSVWSLAPDGMIYNKNMRAKAGLRILVVGAGATGGYFGGRLAAAGRDVTFLVRPNRAARLQKDGLEIASAGGDVTLRPHLVTAGELASAYDVILLTVKTYSLAAAMTDFAPAVGDETAVLPVLNGIRHIDLLTRRFGEAHVLGGVAIVSNVLDEQGRIVQLNAVQELVYGELDGRQSARLRALDETFQHAGFDARPSTEIVQAMWEKWVFVASVGAITCLVRGSIGAIEAAPGGTELALAVSAECSVVATASGYPPRQEAMSRATALLTAKGSSLTSSMYRDLQLGREIEVEEIVGDMVRRGRECGLKIPLLAAAYAQLSIYSMARSGR
jgi:2-dehydropantoate 2-reductase